ncbi:unnamed protein product [Rotaria sp. Silwood2]|nr:unnamed protein product [Rotaria sp. Silwood2]CAF3132701.1 unnamed protein product [Rotaria sp. Silwood2]CAF3427574.1 unnamed protein product [Rotaria sp. Silwood2]CAF4438661.1 unnamed protein product [Rotaria sp. Silwood2]CAF4457291.1 unnamed protein product [Rotaria sp. Silwood2]
MVDQTNETLPQLSDSFYDDNDSTISPPALISNIQIVTSKPPIYRQQTQSSNSSDTSEHDITDVSSINEQQHPFHLEAMKNVLFGLSAPTSGLPSPSYSDQQQLNKRDMQILTDNYSQQPYIHNCTKDHHQRIRLTSSAINRQQQQQRIERENLKILERLQNIRPTRSLKRDELLFNYDRLMGVNTYPMEPRYHQPKRPSSTTNISSTFSISESSHRSQSRPSSATNSLNNTNNNSVRSRPVSASHRSSSARKRTWNDRWQQQE